MGKTIRFHGVKILFPQSCVVCAQPAEEHYKIMRTFNYGKRNITIELPLPMCKNHYLQAKTKSPSERTCERIGMIVGGIVGLLVMGALLNYWSASNQGAMGLNLLLAGVVGLGAFLIVWVTTLLWIAPRYAFSEAKAARNSVRLEKYSPAQEILELSFVNERVADQVVRQNSPIVLP